MSRVSSTFRRFLLCLFLAAGAARAAYDPPVGYYSPATGLSGSALKAALHNRIKGHTALPYSPGVYNAIDALDEDPANPANVLLLYSGVSVPKADKISGSTAGSWNREHTWPLSWILGSGNTSSGAPTDLFHLYACDADVNNRRANQGYDQVSFAPDSEAPQSGSNRTWWNPRDIDKGRIARGLFYMVVRYESEDPADLELSDQNVALRRMGRLSALLAWHRQFPPTEAERKRNHAIYTTYQFNRNPFIDNPLFADQVFTGDTPFGAWRRAIFTAVQLADTEVSGDAADPDGDGLPNRLEYLHNLRPLVADPGTDTRPTLVLLPPAVSGGSSRLALSYRKHRYATDLVIACEASEDLALWTAFTPISSTTTYLDALAERVTVETPFTTSRRFLRLRVERP